MEVTLAAADGYALGATLYGVGERAVLIMPATGVPQSYYAKFAAYLAERGCSALTFDYRGIGRSLAGKVSELGARMRDWALLDAAAAFRFLGERKIMVVRPVSVSAAPRAPGARLARIRGQGRVPPCPVSASDRET